MASARLHHAGLYGARRGVAAFDVAFAVPWCLANSALWNLSAGAAPSLSGRILLFLLGTSYLLLAGVQWRSRTLMRAALASVLLLDVAISLGGHGALLPEPIGLIRVLLQLYLAIHFVRPTGLAGAKPRLEPARFLARMTGLLLVLPLVYLVKAGGLDGRIGGLLIAGTVFGYGLWLKPRLASTLAFRLTARPPELSRGAWRTFRQAWRARQEGRADDAAALLAPLATGQTVGALRALLQFDQACATGPLQRLVFDATYRPERAERDKILAEVRRVDLDRMLAWRCFLMDEVLGSAEEWPSLLADEYRQVVLRLCGTPRLTLRETMGWWERVRDRQSGADARSWLATRLWAAECLSAAEFVAGKTADPLLQEAVCLARILEEWPAGQWPMEWTEARAWNLCLVPSFADNLGLLLLDGPFLTDYGLTNATGRLTRRLELVRYLRGLWHRHDHLAVEVPWLLFHLTGYPVKALRTAARFEGWWQPQADAQQRFDKALNAGFRAVGRQDITGAARHFKAASDAWPARTCALYNYADCLMHLHQYAVAEAPLRRLTEIEPKEPLWWKTLGDCLLKLKRGREALTAYERTIVHGGGEDALAVRLGVTLALQGRYDEAEKALRTAVGPDPDAEVLDELSAILEAEGAYPLAQRYRERAFYKSLNRDPDPIDGDDGDLLSSG